MHNVFISHSCFILWLVLVEIAQAQQSPHDQLDHPCSDCHTTESWSTLADPLQFDHSKTSFNLLGQHRSLACKSCHTNLKFRGTPRSCFFCHLRDYEGTVTINHKAAGFSAECEDCHSAGAGSWQSSFDHNRTQFQTRGAHEAVACDACHRNNRFKGTPVECISCHQTDYANTQHPNHLVAGFPTTCATCHRALTWQPAVFFPHPWFPIGRGDTHSPGRWNACTDCHTAEPNFTVFECINCHEHSQARMDSRHGEVSGYVYQSNACYRCHPSGSGGG